MTIDFNAQTGNLNDFTSADLFLSDFFHFDQETVEFYSPKDTLERLGVKFNRTTQDKKLANIMIKHYVERTCLICNEAYKQLPMSPPLK